MAGGTGTNVALRTMVMIGSLLVLLLMALLPGPVGWLVGGGEAGATARDSGSVAGGERAATDLAAATERGGDLAPVRTPNEPGQAPKEDPSEEESSRQVTGPEEDGPASGSAAGKAAPAVAVEESAPEDRCWSITAQLRQEGAAYYRLESWESEPSVFRFQCTMPVGEAKAADRQVYRTFEAAGNNPAAAMERVLADVRAWNAGGRY
jgi:hypothetical protein